MQKAAGSYNIVEFYDNHIVRKPISRLNSCEFENITIMLDYLEQCAFSFQTPIVLQYKCNDKEQFWIQSRIPGISVLHIIDGLNDNERVELAKDLAHCVLEIFNSSFSHCGVLVPTSDDKNTFSIGRPLYFGQSYCYSIFDALSSTNTPTDLLSFLTSRFSILFKTSGGNKHYQKFIEAANQKCDAVHFYHEPQNCILHKDLLERNILVHLENHTKISGIVDWDDSEIVPSEIAYTYIADLHELWQPQIAHDAFLETMETQIPFFNDTVTKMKTSGLMTLAYFAIFNEKIHTKEFLQNLDFLDDDDNEKQIICHRKSSCSAPQAVRNVN